MGNYFLPAFLSQREMFLYICSLERLRFDWIQVNAAVKYVLLLKCSILGQKSLMREICGRVERSDKFSDLDCQVDR